MLGTTLASSGNRNAHGMAYRSTGRGGHMQHSLNQSGSFGLNVDLKPTFGQTQARKMASRHAANAQLPLGPTNSGTNFKMSQILGYNGI